MGHIHNEPGQYDHTVSAYIVNVSGSEAKLLLHLHKRIAKWLQPGGHIELDENPWHAIEREIAEETGYKMRQLRVLQPHGAITNFEGSHPLPLSLNTHRYGEDEHYHTDAAYGFLTHELPDGQIGDGESAKFRWVTLEDMDQIPDEQMPRHTRAIGTAILSRPERWLAL